MQPLHIFSRIVGATTSNAGRTQNLLKLLSDEETNDDGLLIIRALKL